MQVWHLVLTTLHALAGAAFFGSMFYSFYVVQPRSRLFFAQRRDFESFLASLAQGARYKVLLAFTLLGISGLALLFVRPSAMSSFGWLVLGVKGVLFLAALVLFGYVSWHLWPVRLFALPEELPHLDRVFRWAAFAMLILVGLSFFLGTLAHCTSLAFP
jgi:hypothetical protein